VGAAPTGHAREKAAAREQTRHDRRQWLPAYSMGAAADLLGVEPAFPRALGHDGPLTPHRSDARARGLDLVRRR